MKKVKIFQTITAFLLAIVLVVTGVYHPYLFGEKDNEAQAADSLTEIGWEDFNNVEYGKTYSTQWTKFTYKDTSVTTLNNTKFTGRIKFSDYSHIRFGGSNESFGLHLSVLDGKFYVWSETFNLDDIDVDGNKHHVRHASDFGITSGSFANEDIKLTITMTNVKEESATVGVWINDIPVDEEFTITENGVYGASLGNTIGLAGGTITVLAPLPPTGLTEIGWRNFGIKSEATYDNHAYVTYAGGDSLDGTLFSGDIKMGSTDDSQHAEIRYAASGEGSQGLHICVGGGMLYIKSDTMDVVSGLECFVDANMYPVYYYAQNFGVGDTFSNAQFNLKISTEIDGSNYTFGIWINDIMVGGYFTLTPSATWTTAGGNQIGLDLDKAGFVTVYPEIVTYKDITWKDFTGNVSGVHTTATKFTYKHGDSLNNTRFTGQIQLSAGSGIRYGGAADSYGLHIYVDGNGKLLLKSDTFNLSDDLATKLFDAKDFDIASGTFANEEIKITITMADVTPQSATVGVWVNDKEVDSEFVITGNGLYGGALGNCFGIYDCNSSAPITIPKPLPPTDLTKISWENFGITADTTYESHTTVTYASGDSLNGTLFSGDITMDNSTGGESEIRYAASEGGSWGLHIQVAGDGQLYLQSHTMEPVSGSSTSYAGPHKASDFDLPEGKTFTNTRFNLKISTEIVGNEYTFGVWVNDIMVGDYFTLTPMAGTPGAGGNQIGMQLNKAGKVTAHIVQEETELTPIDWTDFGVSYGSKYTAWQQVEYTGTTLNNTVFEDYVMMTENTQFGYASSTGWDGLFIGLTEDGRLRIKSDTCGLTFSASGTAVDNVDGYEPSVFNLSSLVNTKFKLKIETTELTVTSAKFRVWVNDVQVGDDTMIATITDTANYAFGDKIGLQRSNSGAMYIPANVTVPEGLTTITWEEFGIAANTAYQPVSTVESILYGSASHYVNLNNTLFNGDVQMGAGAHFRYGGSAGDFGLHITIAADGTLVLASDTFTFDNIGKSYVPELFGLTNFVDTKFNLKIALTEVTDTTMKACVWVNNQAVKEEFVMTSKSAEVFKTGNCLALYNGTITPYTIFKQPTGLPVIAFRDFNNNGFNSSAESANGATIENGTYGRNWIKAVYSGTETTLLGMSFRDTIKLVPYEAYTSTYYYTLQYGGGKTYGQDGGIRLSLVGDNLVIHPAVSEFTGTWTLTPDKVGLKSFANTEFQLGIDTVKYGNHVLLWIYFDGVCYNNAPFFLVNFASEMSNTLMMIAGNQTSTEYLADKLIIGATLKTLTSLHHDIALGNYKLPTGLTKISGKTYQGETIDTTGYNAGSTIDQTGIYTVQFDDGVSLYEQTIYLALTGDNNCNDVLDACDLVRLVKLNRQAGYTLEEGATAAADADNSGTISEEDVKTLREVILGKNDTSSVMPIVGFRGPMNNQVTDEMYELIAKAGINTIIQYENTFSSAANSRYQVYEQLTLAQNHNMKITVKDEELNANPNADSESVNKALSKYNFYQSYGGLFLIDEPVGTYFPYNADNYRADRHISYWSNLALMTKQTGQKIYSNVQSFHYTNGDSSSWYNHKGSAYQYLEHLREYVTQFKPSELSFDYYPFDKNLTGNGVSGDVEGASQYFQNLAMVRAVAQDPNYGNGMPFWVHIQAGSNWNNDVNASLDSTDNSYPTEGEFKWNVNTSLAFGAKGVQYFPLVQPDYFASTTTGTPDYKRNGLIGADGSTNMWYEFATEANAQIAAIDHVLMNATSEGLMSTGGYAQSQATETVRSIALYKKSGWSYSEQEPLTTKIFDSYNGATITSSDATYGALTGCFTTADGKYALYIVNYNPNSDNTITVDLSSAKPASITLNAVTEETTTQTITKTLGAGEAMLIVF